MSKRHLWLLLLLLLLLLYPFEVLRRVVTKCLHDAEVCTDIHIQATEFAFMGAEVTRKKQVSRLCVAVGGYVAADHTCGTRFPSIYLPATPYNRHTFFLKVT